MRQIKFSALFLFLFFLTAQLFADGIDQTLLTRLKTEGCAAMRAQEKFCEKTENAYIITRAASFLEYSGKESKGWFDREPEDEFKNCRDSFFGIDNEHLNEKGHKTVAKYAVPNIIRVVYEGKEPVLEEERIIALK